MAVRIARTVCRAVLARTVCRAVLARAAAVGLLVLLLGSCSVFQFIFGSIFPATATLQKGQADLSGSITASDGNSYDLKVVDAGGSICVVLVGTPGGASTSTAFVYDSGLTLKRTLTGLTGNGVMFDGFTNQILVGGVELNPSDFSMAATQPPAGFAFYGGSGNGGIDGFFSSTGLGNVGGLSIALGSSGLYSEYFNATWNSAAHTAPPTYPPVLSATITNVALDAILDDGNPAGNVVLALSPPNSNSNNSTVTTYFLTLSKASFVSSAPAQAGLLDTAPHRDGLETNTFGFAQGSIVAWDKSAASWVRIDPVTMATTASFYSAADPSHFRFAFPVSGGTFYQFDPTSRVITEYAAWW